MKHQIQAVSDSGMVVLRDASVEHPAPDARLDEARRQLLETAGEGSFFFFDADDAVDLRLDCFVEEEPSGLPEYRFQPLGGAFLLRVPSGRLKIGGVENWTHGDPAGNGGFAVEPGAYALRVRGLDEIPGDAVDREYAALVGEEELRFRDRIDRIGLVGCVTTLVATGMIIVPWTRQWWLWALAILLAGLVPLHGLRLLPRYRSVERRISEYERSLPSYAIVLRRVEDSSHLSGGHLEVR